jgi:DNA sulfur modification protein DndB
MNQDQIEKFQQQVIHASKIKSQITKRKKTFVNQSIFPELVERYKEEGWKIEKEFKKKVRLQKEKSFDHKFEDQVWLMAAKMGFSAMNVDRNFKLYYSESEELTQQIDVFAVDDETILIIECKATEEITRKANFKEAIEAIGGRKEGILKSLKKIYPNSKRKVKFIFATKNYILSQNDIDRLANYGILHFDDEIVDYYTELLTHLGKSARFQLLGNLFEGQDIPELENRIPAIQGKMGGHTYYSFSIEPEKLLKIGYVLHRNKANKKLMPTYQRLIKRARLKSVQEFVDDGGFFPNSVIIDLESKSRRGLQFDKATSEMEYSLSRIGTLHLPKKYRSAFIIDGQHRLYGYANSEYKSKNTIPVVAFVNLERKEQVKLFMQINENQKAVPKNLRNTLNADLLWNSPNLNDQVKALKLQIAQDLGEEKGSPLFNRVIVGENKKSHLCCITIDSIKIALDRSNFFGLFSATAIKSTGTFYRGDNDTTYDKLFPFIQECLSLISEPLKEEWNKGDLLDGYLAINPGIESLIRLFSDVVDHLEKGSKINPKTDSIPKIIEEIRYYADPLVDFLTNLTDDQKRGLRKSYGTAGRAKYWRTLQQAVNIKREEFQPDGLDNYWKDEDKRFNEESFKMIRDIETHFKEDFKNKLRGKYGTDWFRDGLPKKVYDHAIQLSATKNYEEKTNKYEPWDCLHLIDYREIAIYGSNWSELFEKLYVPPSQKGGNKKDKTAWIEKLNKIRNENSHSYSVKEDEYSFLVDLHDWLIKDNIEKD